MLVPKRPRLEVEYGVDRILCDLPQQLLDAFGFRLEHDVVREGRIQIDFVERSYARGIFDNARIPYDGADKPRLAPNIACVQNGLAITLNHCSERVSH